MKVSRIPHGDATVLAISGKVMGGPEVDEFKAAIKDLVDAGCRNFILDFAEVPWINSTGLGILIAAHHTVRAAEGQLRICSVTDRVLSIFHVSQLERVFEVHADRDKALASFR